MTNPTPKLNTHVEGRTDCTVVVFSSGESSATWTGTHKATLYFAWILFRCTLAGMWRGFWRGA